MPAATPALVKGLPWAGHRTVPWQPSAIHPHNTLHHGGLGVSVLQVSARAQGGEGLPSWHGPPLSAQPGTRRPARRGDPSLRSQPPAFARATPGTRETLRSHLSPSPPSAVLCCGCCSVSSLFAGEEAESLGDLGLPPPPPHRPPTVWAPPARPPPRLLCETSRPPAPHQAALALELCEKPEFLKRKKMILRQGLVALKEMTFQQHPLHQFSAAAAAAAG